MAGTLLIGSRRYSSWSLRGWMAVRLAGLDVEDRVIALKGAGRTTEIHALSPNRQVPYLEHDGAQIWESLAICEYCAEMAPALWPRDRTARAHARSLSAQMHAGFRALRQACPMDTDRAGRSPETFPAGITPDDLAADVAMLDASLRAALTRGGTATPWLFGMEPGIADCMYAPVALRIHQYALTVSPLVRDWVDTVRAHPLVRAWCEAADAEPESWRLVYADK